MTAVPSPGSDEAIGKGPERPFFDPNNLPEIDTVDLTYLKSCRKVNFEPGVSGVDTKKALRFILEAGDGTIDDESVYKDLEERAIGEMMVNAIDGEKLGWLYEVLESLHPRVPSLMTRIRQETIFADQEFITLSKLSLLATFMRFES